MPGGYAGTVYYFWETQKHRYYAYRDLRPKFYEDSRQSRVPDAVLWELPGTLRQLRNCRLDLAGARVSGERNLSATTQCRGTLLQKTSPGAVLPPSAVAEDFSSLLPRSRPGLGELERLAGLLEARAHTLHKQDDRLLEVMFQAEHYIALCRERCQELEILRAWQEQQAQEAEKEEGGDLT